MGCVQLLRKIGLLRGATRADIEDAMSEDVVRTSINQRSSADRIIHAAEANDHANNKLLDSIRRTRTSAFADFERSVKNGGDDR